MPKVNKKRQYSYGKPKRKLNSKFIILVALIVIAVVGFVTIPKMITDSKLKDLGYQNDTLPYIYELNLDKYLIDNEFYTDVLDENLKKDNFNKDYIELFSVKNNVSQDDILLYNRLSDKGYTVDQTTN